MHLLVADDLLDNAESLALLLQAHGGVDSVDIALDGLQAVQMARARRPDVAILDIEMPRLSGVDAGATIVREVPGPTPLLVAMSGNPDSVDTACASGIFQHVLGKPVPLPVLLSILDSVATRR